MLTYNLLLLQRLDGETAIHMLERMKLCLLHIFHNVWKQNFMTSDAGCKFESNSNTVLFYWIITMSYLLSQRLPAAHVHVQSNLEKDKHSFIRDHCSLWIQNVSSSTCYCGTVEKQLPTKFVIRSALRWYMERRTLTSASTIWTTYHPLHPPQLGSPWGKHPGPGQSSAVKIK